MGNNSVTAVLVALRISMWSARKYDKGISQEVSKKYAATLEAGRYNKCLLPGDADTYKVLANIVGEARTAHYSQTLPWSDEGWRMLPTSNYMEYSKIMRGHRESFETALNTFVGDYPTMRARAKQLLNGMYNEADYPDDVDIATRFGYSLEYNPLPQAGDFRVSLPKAELDAIEAQTANRVQEALKAAHEDMWKRLHDCVSHIVERLGDPEAIFRDSLIDNADDLIEIMGRLNNGLDPNLDDMCNKLRVTISASPTQLRHNKRIRRSVADEATDLLKSIEQVFKS